MSYRTEVQTELNSEIQTNGKIILSRSGYIQATQDLAEATRAYEEARISALRYQPAFYGLGVFGSARVNLSSRRGKFTTLFVEEVIENNPNIPLAIITGGGPGIMEAANRGVHNVLERNRSNGRLLNVQSIGVTIDLPHQEKKNRYVHTEDRHPEFGTRKQSMLDNANGILAMPGGFGTLYETLMAIQNIQTGHIEKDFPIVLHGFWEPAFDKIYNTLYHDFHARNKRPMINAEDMNLLVFVKKRHEAVDIFSGSIQKWWNHTGRFVEWVV